MILHGAVKLRWMDEIRPEVNRMTMLKDLQQQQPQLLLIDVQKIHPYLLVNEEDWEIGHLWSLSNYDLYLVNCPIVPYLPRSGTPRMLPLSGRRWRNLGWTPYTSHVLTTYASKLHITRSRVGWWPERSYWLHFLKRYKSVPGSAWGFWTINRLAPAEWLSRGSIWGHVWSFKVKDDNNDIKSL